MVGVSLAGPSNQSTLPRPHSTTHTHSLGDTPHRMLSQMAGSHCLFGVGVGGGNVNWRLHGPRFLSAPAAVGARTDK